MYCDHHDLNDYSLSVSVVTIENNWSLMELRYGNDHDDVDVDVDDVDHNLNDDADDDNADDHDADDHGCVHQVADALAQL